MEIYVFADKVLASWGFGPVRVLSSSGPVVEQRRVQGDLVWMSNERGFDYGHAVGYEEGFEAGVRASALDHASNPTAVAS